MDYISITYSKNRAPKSSYPKELIEYLIKRFDINRAGKVLEIGCGRGDFLLEFQKSGLQAFGIDRESSAIEFSKDLDIRKCDISTDKLPFPENYFDVIYHKSLIEHLYDPDNLMKETLRTLKPGGKLIVLTPDWWSQMKNFYEDITHCRPYDESSMQDALLIYGFKNILTERFHQLPVLWKYKIVKIVSSLLKLLLNVHVARKLTNLTKIKFFRWSVELMVLGYGEK